MTDPKTMGELVNAAGGPVEIAGRVVSVGPNGEFLIDGRGIEAHSPETVESVVSHLRDGGGNRYIDPAKNPMIKTGD